ncbi:hypothetical protein [Marinobacter sp.]|uniref:hypothetical protein n=1 Tax=unclassified Marinobacter TaxID=83889 RepID=UPI003A8FFDEF
MNKFTLILAAALLALSVNSALAMDGYADRVNEAKTYPNKTTEMMVDVRSTRR